MPNLSPSERRISPRYHPAHGTLCRLKPRPGEQGIVGLVWNISSTGVSMLVAAPPEPGTMFEGELVADGWGVGLPIALRVVHVRQVKTGDYLMGAQFGRPLAEDEMDTFLAPSSRALDVSGPGD